MSPGKKSLNLAATFRLGAYKSHTRLAMICRVFARITIQSQHDDVGTIQRRYKFPDVTVAAVGWRNARVDLNARACLNIPNGLFLSFRFAFFAPNRYELCIMRYEEKKRYLYFLLCNFTRVWRVITWVNVAWCAAPKLHCEITIRILRFMVCGRGKKKNGQKCRYIDSSHDTIK